LSEQNNEPRVHPGADENRKPPKTSKRTKLTIVCLLILAAGVLAYSVHIAVQYRAFRNQLSAVQDIHVGDIRNEVKYRLGFPTFVLRPPEKTDWGWPQRILKVDGDRNDQNSMPPTKTVDDYNWWQFDDANSRISLTIEFNESGIVESIELYSKANNLRAWGPIAGIYCGDSEKEILRLGVPTKQSLDGVTKTIEYQDLGLIVTLTKGKAYMIKLTGLTTNNATVFWRFIRR